MKDDKDESLDAIFAAWDKLCENAKDEPCAEQITKNTKVDHPLVDFPARHMRELTLYGVEWQSAYQKALNICENGGMVVAHGNRGTGKTQIAYEIARNARFKNTHHKPIYKDGFSLQAKPRACVYTKAMDIFIELKSSFKNSGTTEKQILDKLVEAVFLVIDEAHVRGDTKFEDDKLTHIIDKRYDAMRATMLITNLDKRDFAAQLSPSIKSRLLEVGGGIECNWETYRKP
jgi:DNA replication protein DnaC